MLNRSDLACFVLNRDDLACFALNRDDLASFMLNRPDLARFMLNWVLHTCAFLFLYKRRLTEPFVNIQRQSVLNRDDLTQNKIC